MGTETTAEEEGRQGSLRASRLVLMWTILPGYLGMLLSKQIPATALTTPIFVYLFGGIIIVLQAAIALTEGMSVMVRLELAFYILVAFYVWAATNGRNLIFIVAGTSIGFGFQLLVLVVILPSLWGAIRSPFSFLNMQRARVAQLQVASSSP
jgi:hypothetical protein